MSRKGARRLNKCKKATQLLLKIVDMRGSHYLYVVYESVFVHRFIILSIFCVSLSRRPDNHHTAPSSRSRTHNTTQHRHHHHNHHTAPSSRSRTHNHHTAPTSPPQRPHSINNMEGGRRSSSLINITTYQPINLHSFIHRETLGQLLCNRCVMVWGCI